MQCPRCNRTQIGRIANAQFYCWSCFLEFHQGEGGWECFELDEDGALVPFYPVALGVGVEREAGPIETVTASSAVV